MTDRTIRTKISCFCNRKPIIVLIKKAHKKREGETTPQDQWVARLPTQQKYAKTHNYKNL